MPLAVPLVSAGAEVAGNPKRSTMPVPIRKLFCRALAPTLGPEKIRHQVIDLPRNASHVLIEHHVDADARRQRERYSATAIHLFVIRSGVAHQEFPNGTK